MPRGGFGLVGISATIAYYLIEVGYQVGYHSGVEQNRAFNLLILLFLIQFAGLSLHHASGYCLVSFAFNSLNTSRIIVGVNIWGNKIGSEKRSLG